MAPLRERVSRRATRRRGAHADQGATVVKHGLAPFDENIEHIPWTDDNPHGSVVVWTSPDATPIILAYNDQRRRWLLDGLTLALDPGETKAPFHASINAAYGKLLGAIDAHVLR